jgi:hypothetical protein
VSLDPARPPEATGPDTPRWGLPARRLLLVLLAFLAAGALAGVVWEWWWTPPTGVSVEGSWYLDNQGLQDDFSGTGVFVLVGLVTGLLLGVATALATRSHEVLTLVTVGVGSVVATAVMAVVGPALGPPDPGPLAQGQDDYTSIPADLQIHGRAPYAALPAGALTGLGVCFVGFGGSGRKRLRTEPDG